MHELHSELEGLLFRLSSDIEKAIRDFITQESKVFNQPDFERREYQRNNVSEVYYLDRLIIKSELIIGDGKVRYDIERFF